MAIKYRQDHYDAKFFLTGSSSFYLKNLFPESLAGRKVAFELMPLDFRVFLVFKGREAPEGDGLAERYIVSREYTDGRGIIPATEI